MNLSINLAIALGVLLAVSATKAAPAQPLAHPGSTRNTSEIHDDKELIPIVVPPIFVLAPTADVAVGHNVFFSTELGGTALVAASPSIRLGLSGALSQNITNSMEGCSIVTTCVRSWKRVSANFEYHHFPRYIADFWWGAQAGPEWRQAETRSSSTWMFVADTRTLAVIQPNVGIDIMLSAGHGNWGVGFFAGLPIILGSPTQDTGHVGLLLGARVLVGVN